jgi:hypothetical protein
MKKPQNETLNFRNSAIERFKAALSEITLSKEEITNFDYVLGKMNPEHLKFDFNTGELETPRMLIEDRSTANPQAEEARVVSPEKPARKTRVSKADAAKAVVIGHAPKPAKKSKPIDVQPEVLQEQSVAEAQVAAKAVRGGKAPKAAKTPKPAKISASARKAAADIVTSAKGDLESAARETLNRYFKDIRPQDEITNILRGKKGPVEMNAIAKLFQSIHGIDLSKNSKLEGLYKTRLQAQIAHMMTKGLVGKQRLAGESGKEVTHYHLIKSAATKPAKAPKAPKATPQAASETAEFAGSGEQQPEVQTAA